MVIRLSSSSDNAWLHRQAPSDSRDQKRQAIDTDMPASSNAARMSSEAFHRTRIVQEGRIRQRQQQPRFLRREHPEGMRSERPAQQVLNLLRFPPEYGRTEVLQLNHQDNLLVPEKNQDPASAPARLPDR